MKPESGWTNATQTAGLTAEDGAHEDELGHAVAISGETIVGGAYNHNTGHGAVYVFVRPPTVAISSPTNGASYTQGQAVDAGFACSAPEGASITECAPVYDHQIAPAGITRERNRIRGTGLGEPPRIFMRAPRSLFAERA